MLPVLRSAVLVGLMTAAVLAGSPVSAVAAGHDGQWSVLIITEKGQCDRGYRYSVAIANGQVHYQGDTAVDLSGTVTPNGAVKVSIKFGGQGANGTGRLSGNAGGGTWHSTGGGDKDCSGRWEAERR
ncbi:MAG: hypothetical protein GC182_14410 [Rhodopseudomonas sp.]|nr:hypothetical protein [Rhodopseudomonas sp.]